MLKKKNILVGSLGNLSLLLSRYAAFYTLDIKTRNIYLQAISDGFHDNKTQKWP